MFDNLEGYIWIDGELKKWSDAKIHVMTHGLHYASSVFEGIRSYNGKIFKAKEHYERLQASANYLGFKVPYTVEQLEEATQLLIKKGNYNEPYIRAFAFCGSKVMSVSHKLSDVHCVIGMWERPVFFPEKVYKEGISMNISNWQRPDPNTAPVHSKAAGLYMISSLSKTNAEKEGFDDALMLDYKGDIAEASSSNIFLVIDGKLYTPKPTCFLNGITRLTCIDIAKELKIDVIEKTLTLSDLEKAQEVFLTGTAIEILPVGSVKDKDKKWTFTPGKITFAIHEKYKVITRN